jgi:hypothetical protein
MAKKKEEIEGKEYNQCTFKPKLCINPEFDSLNRGERFDQLYRIGTSVNLNRRDKNKEDFEIKDENELTFKPNTEKLVYLVIYRPAILGKKIDISFDDKEYLKQFNRLKSGRMVLKILIKERKLKEIINSREPFTSKINLEDSIENSVFLKKKSSDSSRKVKADKEKTPSVKINKLTEKEPEEDLSNGEKSI